MVSNHGPQILTKTTASKWSRSCASFTSASVPSRLVQSAIELPGRYPQIQQPEAVSLLSLLSLKPKAKTADEKQTLKIPQKHLERMVQWCSSTEFGTSKTMKSQHAVCNKSVVKDFLHSEVWASKLEAFWSHYSSPHGREDRWRISSCYISTQAHLNAPS